MVKQSSLPGHQYALNAAALADVTELICESPSLFLDEIGEWLALYHDQPIHTSSLHRTLQDIGITYNVMRRVAAERDDIARTNWLHEVISHYSAEQIVVSPSCHHPASGYLQI